MKQITISDLRLHEAKIVCLGSHPGIIQSILDFDYASGKAAPSIVAIIASGRKSERYFVGDREVLLPVKPSLDHLTPADRTSINYFINLNSGRRVLASTTEVVKLLPNLCAGNIFAEGVPEKHALALKTLAQQHNLLLAGGASVGLVIPGALKLGAIGGTQAQQLEQSRLLQAGGQMAVISTSGGMVNEIIRTVALSGYGVSFALALGGERFPILGSEEAFLLAEHDPGTKSIVYFGELGGTDEYCLADLIKTGKVTKPVIAYIAGSVAELFKQPPQFGHAKAMARNKNETAAAKSAALASVGVSVSTVYADFVCAINDRPGLKPLVAETRPSYEPSRRQRSLFANSISYDENERVYVLGQELLGYATNHSFAYLVASMFLGRPTISKELEQLVDFVIRLLVDHGPYVSGAVNTMVSARAGKDLVSSLVTGLLTVGPRFGGAINGAAGIWLEGVSSGQTASALVESYARRRQYLPGIGHRKYSVDHPDPRVQAILAVGKDTNGQFVAFAQAVQDETTQKKGNLILNVDGAIAAVLLDILHTKEGYGYAALQELIETEFFNGLFILSRSVGFMAHYFDQRRLDEGLFRLSPDDVLRS